jgi:hypothetical protein
MLEDLKLGARYDGFLYLVESTRNPPKLKSHHHIELELNLVVQGTITYVVNGRRSTFQPRTLYGSFPSRSISWWIGRIMRSVMYPSSSLR